MVFQECRQLGATCSVIWCAVAGPALLFLSLIFPVPASLALWQQLHQTPEQVWCSPCRSFAPHLDAWLASQSALSVRIVQRAFALDRALHVHFNLTAPHPPHLRLPCPALPLLASWSTVFLRLSHLFLLFPISLFIARIFSHRFATTRAKYEHLISRRPFENYNPTRLVPLKVSLLHSQFTSI